MKWPDWAALWVFVFGVWPLANPSHHADTLMSRADIALHVVAAVVLVVRWNARREVDVDNG